MNIHEQVYHQMSFKSTPGKEYHISSTIFLMYTRFVLEFTLNLHKIVVFL